MLETDASDYAYGSILSQLQQNVDKKKQLHPVAFLSKQFNEAEVNYDIHDKEMLAIVRSFHAWEVLLKSCQHCITIWTDHKNLEYFNTTKSLTRRQARWAEFLSEFDFIVNYRPGEKNTKPDALSRRADHRPKGGSEAQKTQTRLFKPGQLKLSAIKLSALKVVSLRNQFKSDLLDAGLKDPQWVKIRDAVLAKDKLVDQAFTVEEEVLLYKNRWYIPDNSDIKRQVLYDNHDSKIAGHFGVFKTLERIRQNYHWPKMGEEVQDYVRSCDTCQRDKTSRHKKYGLLQPLEVPYRPWASISMDWIIELLEAGGGFTQIWVIVDRLTKMAHFIPLKTNITAIELAQLFLQHI